MSNITFSFHRVKALYWNNVFIEKTNSFSSRLSIVTDRAEAGIILFSKNTLPRPGIALESDQFLSTLSSIHDVTGIKVCAAKQESIDGETYWVQTIVLQIDAGKAFSIEIILFSESQLPTHE